MNFYDELLSKAIVRGGAVSGLFDEPAVVPSSYQAKRPHEMTRSEYVAHKGGMFAGPAHKGHVEHALKSGLHVPAHVLADYPGLLKPVEKVKPSSVKKVRIVHTKPIHSLSLFDDEPASNPEFERQHPRGEQETFNSKTGKTIKPGQFAPKQDGEDDAQQIRQDVRGQSEAEPSEDVPGAKESGQPRRSRAGAAKQGRGEDRGFDFGGDEPEPSTERSGAVTARADDRRGAGPEQQPVRDTVDDIHLPPVIEDEAEVQVVHQRQSVYKRGNNYRITEEDHVGEAKPEQRYRFNLDAISTLRTIEDEGREATPEEQAILVKYSGWGWAGQLFDDKNDYPESLKSYWNAWKPKYDELKSLLTPEEWASAKGSTKNAHYTAPVVISAMWDAMKRMGFESGKVLEPAAGVGHFVGLMPSEAWAQSNVACVELDSISGRITQQLYQSANVQVDGFERASLPEHYFDLAISNIPFGAYGVSDPLFGKPGLKKLTDKIHNYFFAKALTKVRAGGMIAFVTSNGTMDAPTSRSVREYLQANSDLVGAIRLPNDAFKANAGTEVTTDIIFLRKRDPNDASNQGESWSSVVQHENEGGETFQINEYYARNPQMMLGKMSNAGSMYRGGEQALISDGRNIEEALKEAVETLPAGVYSSATSDATKRSSNFKQANMGDRVGAYQERDGGLFQVQAGEIEKVGVDANGSPIYAQAPNVLVPMAFDGKTAERVKGLIKVRDAGNRLLATQSDPNATDEEYHAAFAAANSAYDSFVAKHGLIHTSANLRSFSSDCDYGLICVMEKYDGDTGKAEKADFLLRRTDNPHKAITSAGSAKEAMLHSLNESNSLDFARMAHLTGQTEEAIQAELSADGVVFHNPQGTWETSEDYLSGDVRYKLLMAEAAAKLDPKYEANAEALRAVQPPDLAPADIEARLGAGWIAEGDVADFIDHILNVSQYDKRDQGAKVKYIPQTDTWVVNTEGNWKYNNGEQNRTVWGVEGATAVDLIKDTLHMKDTVVWQGTGDDRRVDKEKTAIAQAKQTEIQQEFKNWVWQDDERATRLAAVYNTTFNNTRNRIYDGSHLTLDGLSETGRATLNPHVAHAVWRILQSKNTLLDHVVGAGKTTCAIIAAMEMRRLGKANKPMVAVPGHLTEQWGNEIRKLYPSAKVLVAKKEDFQEKNRKQFMAKVATGDWDMVVVAHTSFGSISVRPETEKAFYDKSLKEIDDVIEENKSDRTTVKQLQTQRANMQAKLDARMKKHTDKGDNFIPFEHMGVDHLIVDESHMFKRLSFVTKMNRVKGLSPAGSERAFDMFMKVQHIQGMNSGGGVTFLTGTPITNTLAEMYTLQRYLDPDGLDKASLHTFDSWARVYGQNQTAVEYTVSGRMRPTTSFSKFNNIPELSTSYRKFADVKTQQDVKLPVPDVERVQVIAEPSQNQTDYVNFLANWADQHRDLPEGELTDREDTARMLRITNAGRNNSLDHRLVDPSANDHPGSKVNLCVGHLARIHEETKGQRSTQCVFLDLGIPKAKDKVDGAEGDTESDEDTEEETKLQGSVYADIKRKLIAKGIPEKDIAFIHDAKTDAQKQKIFDDMNSGKLRILIGSSEKMGTGMNAQKKMIALHHLDCPWRPDILEQREGRIIRKGNENKKVRVYSYATGGANGGISTDAFMWQTVERKARAIHAIKDASADLRSSEDVDDMILTVSQMKALASGNPVLLRMAEVDNRLTMLGMQQRAHDRKTWTIKTQVARLPEQIQKETKNIAKLSAMIATRDKNVPEKFDLKKFDLGGESFEKQDDAGTQLMSLARQCQVGNIPDYGVVGHYAGYDIITVRDPMKAQQPFIGLRRPGDGEFAVTFDIGGLQDGAGIFSRMRSNFNQLNTNLSTAEQYKKKYETDLENLQKQSVEFPHKDELNDLTKEMNKIKLQLAELDKEKAGGEDAAPVDNSPWLRFAHRTAAHISAARDTKEFNQARKQANKDAKVRIHKSLLYQGGAFTQGKATADSMGQQVGDTHSKINASLYQKGVSGVGNAIRPVARASAGLEHVDSQHLGGDTFSHQFNAGSALSGYAKPHAENMASRLSGTHDVSPIKTAYTTTLGGAEMAHHSFTATPKVGFDGAGTHHITVSDKPDFATKVHDAVMGAPKNVSAAFRSGVQSVGQSVGAIKPPVIPGSGDSKLAIPNTFANRGVRTAATPAATPTASVAKPAGTLASAGAAFRSAMTSPVSGLFKKETPVDHEKAMDFHKAADALDAKHYASKATKNDTSHFYTHSSPGRTAAELHSNLAAQGHQVGEISRSKVTTAAGNNHHSYGFESIHKDSGERHHINVFSGVKARYPEPGSRRTAADKPEKQDRPAMDTGEQHALIHNLAKTGGAESGTVAEGTNNVGDELHRHKFVHANPAEGAAELYSKLRANGFQGHGAQAVGGKGRYGFHVEHVSGGPRQRIDFSPA